MKCARKVVAVAFQFTHTIQKATQLHLKSDRGKKRPLWMSFAFVETLNNVKITTHERELF